MMTGASPLLELKESIATRLGSNVMMMQCSAGQGEAAVLGRHHRTDRDAKFHKRWATPRSHVGERLLASDGLHGRGQ